MKKIVLLGAVILNITSILASEEINLNEFDLYLKPEQKIAYEYIFDTNEKLLDSYKIELRNLKSSTRDYNKKLKFLNSKIQELEKNRDSEIQKLKLDIKNNPQRYQKI